MGSAIIMNILERINIYSFVKRIIKHLRIWMMMIILYQIALYIHIQVSDLMNGYLVMEIWKNSGYLKIKTKQDKNQSDNSTK